MTSTVIDITDTTPSFLRKYSNMHLFLICHLYFFFWKQHQFVEDVIFFLAESREAGIVNEDSGIFFIIAVLKRITDIYI